MNVLLTGGTGFIGSHLAESLHSKGYRLRCLVRKTSDLHWIQHLPVEYIYGDLFDDHALNNAMKDIDCVYHLAGLTKATSTEEYFRGNHFATRNILNAVTSSAPGLKRFIHVSSLAAVGPTQTGLFVDETTPFHPITAYGASKMEAEKECLSRMGKFPITIVRPPAVYGPRDKDVFEFFNTINKGLQPMIGFNNKMVSLIHVKDLVDGIILAGEHPKGIGQTYFISSERFYSWKEVGETTCRVMEKKALRLKIPVSAVYAIAGISEAFSFITKRPVLLNIEKAKDIVQDAWTCSIAKAQRELGFRESFTLGEGIKNAVAWYREQGLLT